MEDPVLDGEEHRHMVVKRVIHLACVAPPQTGGIGSVAATEVALLNAKGIDAKLLSPQNVPAVWSFGNAARLDLSSVMNDLRAADVVHLQYPFYGTAGAVASLRRAGKIQRLVLTLHMDATADGWNGMIFDLHRRLFQKKILDSADALVVSSRDYAEHSSFKPWADKVIELPFGVDENIFSPGSSTPLRSAQNDKQVLFVGGMDRPHAFKGVDILLRALAELPPHVRGVFVGDGELRAGYESLAKELGLNERLKFLGRIPSDALPNAYRDADVFAFPSTTRAEAFGLVALEAQASGVPVVASDLPGVRTVVANGETGFLVPPSNVHALSQRLKYLCEHDDVRLAMGKRARQRVIERFTWSKHIDGLVKIYSDL